MLCEDAVASVDDLDTEIAVAEQTNARRSQSCAYKQGTVGIIQSMAKLNRVLSYIRTILLFHVHYP